MHHGGPWPAASDPRATSVGTRRDPALRAAGLLPGRPRRRAARGAARRQPARDLAPAGREPLAPAGARPRLRAPRPRGEARPGGRARGLGRSRSSTPTPKASPRASWSPAGRSRKVPRWPSGARSCSSARTGCARPSSASRAATTRSSERSSTPPVDPGSAVGRRLLQQRGRARHVRPRADRPGAHARVPRPARPGLAPRRHAGRHGGRRARGGRRRHDRERPVLLPRARRRGGRAGPRPRDRRRRVGRQLVLPHRARGAGPRARQRRPAHPAGLADPRRARARRA